METQKLRGILIKWDETRGFGFVALGRNSDGTRVTRFVHAKFVERIDCPGGIPEIGCEVLFNERPDPRGPMAVDAEILALKPRIRNEGLKMLTGRVE